MRQETLTLPENMLTLTIVMGVHETSDANHSGKHANSDGVLRQFVFSELLSFPLYVCNLLVCFLIWALILFDYYYIHLQLMRCDILLFLVLCSLLNAYNLIRCAYTLIWGSRPLTMISTFLLSVEGKGM